jgi:hypothetical protein
MQVVSVMIEVIGPKGVWTAKLVVSTSSAMASKSLVKVSKS